MRGFGSGHVVVEGTPDLVEAAQAALPGAPRSPITVSDAASASAVLLAALDGSPLLVHAAASREVVDRLCDDLRRLDRVDLVSRADQLPDTPPDEGRPLEVRRQVPASNPCKLRPSRAAVVSVAAKGGAEVPSGTIRRGERKRTADDVSKCQR